VHDRGYLLGGFELDYGSGVFGPDAPGHNHRLTLGT
jgi:hypothetical protein